MDLWSLADHIADEPGFAEKHIFGYLLYPEAMFDSRSAGGGRKWCDRPSHVRPAPPRVHADHTLPLLQLPPTSNGKYGSMKRPHAFISAFDVLYADQLKSLISFFIAASMYREDSSRIYSSLMSGLLSFSWIFFGCLSRADISEETMIILPLGESKGRNCLVKSIVASTFVFKVEVATSGEGIEDPLS